MELAMEELMQGLSASLERLATAATVMEGLAARMEAGAVEGLAKITASVEGAIEASIDGAAGVSFEEGGALAARGAALEKRLLAAEQALAVLQASARASAGSGANEKGVGQGRRTLPSATVQLLAKQGIDAGETVDVGSLDAALTGLSVEQRMAVKAQMLRSGSLVR